MQLWFVGKILQDMKQDTASVDPYYAMIEEEAKKHPRLTLQQVRILVNDRLAKEGYMPNRGHRDDDKDFQKWGK